MQVQGKIKVIGKTATFGAKEFKKRELVVVTDDQYPQTILLEFVQDKCDILDKYKVGDDVTVGINLRGREWVNPEGVVKYFNTIQGWRIEKGTGENSDSAKVEEARAEVDDLPF